VIRVLVADDSITARALIVAVLQADPDIEVVGQARDGAEAVALAKALRPDVIAMDFQMPVLDGFQAATQIMMEVPTPIVIVSGSLDLRDVMVSMEAMHAGALAIVAKPTGPGAPTFARESRYFANTVKAMSQVKIVRRFANRTQPAKAAGRPPRSGGVEKKRLVAIAASTGGPAALHKIITELPSDFPAPILVVQHIAIGFAEGLSAWLNRACRLTVKLAERDEPLRPGVVYLAPDDRHLGISQAHRAMVVDAPPLNGFRPSASHLFAAAADTYGAASLGVILTGMGDDGAAGLLRLREVGGTILAQDEASCAVFGMPKAAIQSGAVDHVLPLEMIAAQLREMVAE
jgi:two-component system chemotaxis response regulator CheB